MRILYNFMFHYTCISSNAGISIITFCQYIQFFQKFF